MTPNGQRVHSEVINVPRSSDDPILKTRLREGFVANTTRYPTNEEKF